MPRQHSPTFNHTRGEIQIPVPSASPSRTTKSWGVVHINKKTKTKRHHVKTLAKLFFLLSSSFFSLSLLPLAPALAEAFIFAASFCFETARRAQDKNITTCTRNREYKGPPPPK